MDDAARILGLTPGDVLGPTPIQSALTQGLLADLKRDEGCRFTAYQDTLGIWTVGYGHAHVAPGTVWTQAQCDAALIADVQEAQRELDLFLPWWRMLDPVRQDVLSELMFNMGWGDGRRGLSTFTNTLAAIKARDFKRGAAGLLASRWAVEVKARASRIAQMLVSGQRAP